MGQITALDIINLTSALVSTILAILAIWLALYFYQKSKEAEKTTEVNINEIKTQTKSLVDISGRMLDKFTDYSTRPKEADETFLVLARLLNPNIQANTAEYPSSSDTEALTKYAVDASITALFYSGLANLALQDLLPQKSADIEEGNNIPGLLDASHQDFEQVSQTLFGINELRDSGILHVYQTAIGWQGNSQIKTMSTLYTNPITDDDKE